MSLWTRQAILAGTTITLISSIFSFLVVAPAIGFSYSGFIQLQVAHSIVGYYNDVAIRPIDIDVRVNNNSSSLQSSKGVDMGILVVTVNVANKTGHLVPSDFKVFVHGNDPMPSSFNGNKSGTLVKLHMGMYSVTTLGPAGYAPAFSGDCSGGMMSIEIKKCMITNDIPARITGK